MKKIMNGNPEILNDYLLYLYSIKNYSRQTILLYNNNIIYFFKFLLKYWDIPISIKDITIFLLINVKENDIIAYMSYLNYFRNNSPKTRKNKIDSLRSFYKYIFDIFPNNIKKNPTLNLPNIQQNFRLPKYLNLENAFRIKNIFNSSNSNFPTRDNLIVTLFLNTGMRLSELVNLNIGDINWEKETIRIMGKGSKERILYLNTNCLKKINEYINIRFKNSDKIKINEPLFVNKYGNRFGKQGIENICKKAFKLADLSDYNYTTHSLRHTVATQLYMNNVDINVIKEILGHSSIVSTEIYSHVHDIKIKEAVEKNPLANFKCKKIRKRRGGET